MRFILFLAPILFSVASLADAIALRSRSIWNTPVIWTPAGLAIGTLTASGSRRFEARFGTTKGKRWALAQDPGFQYWHDGREMPAACPQVASFVVGSRGTSEDCLRAIVYSPPHSEWKRLPVMVWIHGGSFVAGSASAPGLDGSAFAIRNNVVVVVVQYRLGVLGFLPPSALLPEATANLGLSDVILALRWLKNSASAYGGDSSKVTVAGHSSGGQMVRALLASPAAQDLFHSAILQSDPMTYGMAKPSDTQLLSSTFYSSLPNSLAALRTMPLDDLLTAQSQFLAYAPALSPSIPLTSPLRPTSSDARFLPLDFATALSRSQLPPGALSKPLLFTTTKDEFAQAIGALNPSPISPEVFEGQLATFVPDQAQAAAIRAIYPIGNGSDVYRQYLTSMGTLMAWTCAVRYIADLWASRGGRVVVGEFQTGISYIDNQQIPYCAGKVCHEDEIFAVFVTGPTSTALTMEVMSRWGSFVTSSGSNVKPASAASPAWTQYRGESTVLPLGGPKISRTCPAGFFGQSPALFHWQQYS